MQLYIHRILNGQVKDVSFSQEVADKWKWMKNYRVWEAHRKVLLYPENWIEPDFKVDFWDPLAISKAEIDNETNTTTIIDTTCTELG